MVYSWQNLLSDSGSILLPTLDALWSSWPKVTNAAAAATVGGRIHTSPPPPPLVFGRFMCRLATVWSGRVFIHRRRRWYDRDRFYSAGWMWVCCFSSLSHRSSATLLCALTSLVSHNHHHHHHHQQQWTFVALGKSLSIVLTSASRTRAFTRLMTYSHSWRNEESVVLNTCLDVNFYAVLIYSW